MAVVSIVGVAQGIGKTCVAQMLLERLEGWHAARVRVADEVAEERLGLVGDQGYALLTQADDDVIESAEVRRLIEAGAESAAELLAEPLGLQDGLKALRRSFPPEANLLVEGNAFLWGAEADLAIMVLGPGRAGRGLAPVRPSVRELLPRVGLWAWNTRGRPGDEGFFEFPQALAQMGFREAISNAADFHHVNPASDEHDGNAAFLEAVEERLERLWADRGSQEFLRRVDEQGPGRS